MRENPHGGWNGVNVDTKREVRIKSAQRLRKRLDAAPRALPSERLGVPPTTPDVDLKVKAAEDATAPKPIPGAQDAPGAARPTEASKDAGARAGRATGEPGAKGAKAMSLGVELIQPPERIVEQFMEHVIPIDLQIEHLQKAIEKLAHARDLLLPKLMNGEVAV